MINTKKKPVKKFNNNPPKKEVPGPNTFNATKDSKRMGQMSITNESEYNTGQIFGSLHPNIQGALSALVTEKKESVAVTSQ